MKKFVFLIFAISFSLMASAKTELVLGKEMTTIKGASVAEAEMTVMAIMVPKYTLIKGTPDPKAVADCTFAEDAGGTNVGQVTQHVDLKREKDSSYSFQVVDSGMRGSCEYVLDSIFLTVTDKQLYEMFKIRSEISVTHSSAVADTHGAEDLLKLEPNGTIFCEFIKAKEEATGCFHGNDPLVDDLQIKGTGETFTLDFKEKPKNIFDTVAIQTE